MKFKTYVDDTEVEVEFKYYKGQRGFRDKYGVPETPDDEPEIEIQSVTNLSTQKDIILSSIDEQRIEIECWKHLED